MSKATRRNHFLSSRVVHPVARFLSYDQQQSVNTIRVRRVVAMSIAMFVAFVALSALSFLAGSFAPAIGLVIVFFILPVLNGFLLGPKLLCPYCNSAARLVTLEGVRKSCPDCGADFTVRFDQSMARPPSPYVRK